MSVDIWGKGPWRLATAPNNCYHMTLCQEIGARRHRPNPRHMGDNKTMASRGVVGPASGGGPLALAPGHVAPT